MKSVSLWWPKTPLPGNLGDVLSPLILKKLGFSIEEAAREDSGKFVCIGSTAKYIQPGDTVWGTGIMQDSDPIEKEARYLAVRGPLTGRKVGCEVYGDPALLVSHLWPMSLRHIKPVGVVPHYVDHNRHSVGNLDQINLLHKDPLAVIRQMVEYDSILSSSLHGIIIAHAYGIPAGWWKPSNRLSGDGSKFKDYAQSVGIELIPNATISRVQTTLPDPDRIKEVQKGLLNAIQDY